MFRKPKGGTKKNKNVRTRKDDEEEDNDEGTTEFDTGASIRKTMHKQKLLASLPMTTSSLMVNTNGRGTGATHQSTVVAAGVDSNDTGTGVYIKSRSAYTDTGAPAELSVLEKKHQENMESFISAKVGGGDNDENNTKNHTRKTMLRTTMTDEDLYRQLAQDVTNGGGSGEKETTSVTAASPGVGENGDNSNTNERDTEETGVLVGSGIAEVILPTMTRHDSTAGQGNTAAYLSKYQSSAIPAAERHKHAMPDTIPKPLAKFRKQYNTPFHNTNNQDHNNNNTNTNTTNTTNTSNPNSTTTTTTNATKEEEAQQTKTDQTRAGFQSFIGKGSVAAATAENQARAAEQQQYNNHNSNHSNHNNHNNTKRKWQTGQSRDDQAYAHFLKTAIAGRRMR